MKNNSVKNNMLHLNKYFYVGFVLAAVIFIFMKELSSAVIFTGLALVFDPFDQAVPFGKRPVWQRLWLFLHLLLTLVLFWFSRKSA